MIVVCGNCCMFVDFGWVLVDYLVGLMMFLLIVVGNSWFLRLPSLIFVVVVLFDCLIVV